MKHPILHVQFATLCAVILAGEVTRTHGAQPLEPDEIPRFMRALSPPARGLAAAPAAVAEPSRVSLTPRGFLRYVGAPPGRHFAPPPGIAAGPPETVARSFLLKQGRLFGIQSPAADFVVKRNRQGDGRTHVRLQQVHRGLPIVAAEAVVQLNAQGGVECVLGDLATETALLDNGTVPTIPQLSAAAAAARARAAFSSQAGPEAIETTPGELAIFDPAVLDETGPQALVWDLEVFTADRSQLHFRVLVDAVKGDVVRAWTFNPHLLNREISDKRNNPTVAASIVRTEGQAPSGIAEADAAYQFLGETYNFYLTHHGRNGYDNAGTKIQLTVRYCDTNNSCPWVNASAGSPMIFGDGFVADDAVAHEYTHNVTAYESKLIYTNVSGAINESFSDVWGEFVDLSNGSPADTAAVRWDIGEDTRIGRQRSMKDPTIFGHPDRLHSTNYQHSTDTNDWGGVHRNSGVNNKLCYLLTDGATFNGQSIQGMGINQVAALYYEVQANLLTSGASWADLYNALRQAAVNLGWNTADRNNLYRACLAVEFVTTSDGQNIYVDWTSGCVNPAGYRICNLDYGPYKTIGQGVNGANPGDVLRVRSGFYHEPMTIDKVLGIEAENGPVTIGQ